MPLAFDSVQLSYLGFGRPFCFAFRLVGGASFVPLSLGNRGLGHAAPASFGAHGALRCPFAELHRPFGGSSCGIDRSLTIAAAG
ncbi:MAG: hypothetical protein KGL35_28405 [Bradyrhizobium sp.]|nr:hypothetical protein [Bradyrhizobium sp.]